MIDKDRANVHRAVSEMLENPDECGIYPTGKAYDELIALIQSARHEGLGWMHAELCSRLDKGEDPRTVEVPELLEAANYDLAAARGETEDGDDAK